MKKNGLATNMIILLALALIALVFIGFYMAKYNQAYSKSTSCESIGGKCTDLTSCEGKKSALPGCEDNKVCCIEEG
ncbi:MAG: hypothetical protein U9O94_03745 [Nanoarchaeota archaeon]|nr:hypothetical protein [Nanoarchaeota archaeon]